MFAEDEARLLIDAATSAEALHRLVERRVAGEPLEHVVGWADFCGLRVQVTPGVFVPRRRTEFLAAQAIRSMPSPDAVVVELCCGSAAVSAALLAAMPGACVLATDVDQAAVRCARRNVPSASVYIGDLYGPLPAKIRGHVDVLVANAPYVPSEAIALMPPEARDHEPRVALDGGADGLDVHRRIAAAAGQWLAPDGRLLIEVSAAQVPMAAAILAAAGLAVEVARSDDLDATVVIARARAIPRSRDAGRPPPPPH